MKRIKLNDLERPDDLTFEGWLLNPNKEKNVWWWPNPWYVSPYVLEYGSWEKFETYIKKNYPIQFFLRSTINIWFSVKVRQLKAIKYNIKHYFINPRNRMIKNVFPSSWADLDAFIINFHLECIIEIVDHEKKLENHDLQTNEEDKTFTKELLECYDYAKIGRKALLKQLDEAYENISLANFDTNSYKLVDDIQANIFECDTKVCEWVIKNRDNLWV